jgi:serine/threonine protein kinase
MPYYSKGTLLQLMQSQDLDEKMAKFCFVELFHALKEIHSHGIIYRDLKPENILLTDDGHLKICDFNLSTFFSKKEKVKILNFINFTGVGIFKNIHFFRFKQCGTLDYKAPEVLSKGTSYNTLIDYWSLGVILFEIVFK